MSFGRSSLAQFVTFFLASSTLRIVDAAPLGSGLVSIPSEREAGEVGGLPHWVGVLQDKRSFQGANAKRDAGVPQDGKPATDGARPKNYHPPKDEGAPKDGKPATDGAAPGTGGPSKGGKPHNQSKLSNDGEQPEYGKPATDGARPNNYQPPKDEGVPKDGKPATDGAAPGTGGKQH